jgi:soluble lytic murein transglycosylase-like protein
MRPNYKLLLLVGSLLCQLVSSTAGADPSVSEVLHSAYITRLFALETRLATLGSSNQLTTEEQTSLAQMKTERERLCRRIKVTKHYVRKRPAKIRNRMSKGSIAPIVAIKAHFYGVNPDFIHAIIKCESNYDVQALSRAGAMGLMQLMPETAADLGVQDPWSPAENIDGGVRYILAMLKEFRDPWKALVSYNCGPEILRQGLPIPGESRRYASKVLRVFAKRRMEQGGD